MQETFNHWWHDLDKAHTQAERAEIWQHRLTLFLRQLFPIFYMHIKLFLSTDYFLLCFIELLFIFTPLL